MKERERGRVQSRLLYVVIIKLSCCGISTCRASNYYHHLHPSLVIKSQEKSHMKYSQNRVNIKMEARFVKTCYWGQRGEGLVSHHWVNFYR